MRPASEVCVVRCFGTEHGCSEDGGGRRGDDVSRTGREGGGEMTSKHGCFEVGEGRKGDESCHRGVSSFCSSSALLFEFHLSSSST